MNKRDIFVIIPCYNEQPRLPGVLSRLIRIFPPRQIVVIDDGSEIPLKVNPKLKINLLRHSVNLGKGMAMKTGAEFAFSRGAKAVIFMDADGQHEPDFIPDFIKSLDAGYNVVFGSRTLDKRSPLIRRLGNKFASVYINLLFGIYISDILSGFRAMDHLAYQKLAWDSPRYGVETEIVARLGKAKNRLKFIEIPISTIYKDKYKGATLIQAVKILGESILWKLF
jgi:glycosyltransferase involved in cell wall biosynthesis